MSPDDISICPLACGRRVTARVTSYDYQILRPSGSGDDKVVLAVRVA